MLGSDEADALSAPKLWECIAHDFDFERASDVTAFYLDTPPMLKLFAGERTRCCSQERCSRQK